MYIEKVLKLARFFPVFPCLEHDLSDGRKKKSPYIKRWQEDATQDKRQIVAWWADHPNAFIGVPTGSKSGFVAVDLDEYCGLKGEELIKYLPSKPQTLQQSTPNGMHLLFKWDPNRPVRNSTGRMHEGIDVRGEGGYIIASPSNGYKFHGKVSDIADMPPDYYEAMKGEEVVRYKSDQRTAPPEEVISLLNRLDPCQYQDYGSWTRIMLMCHHASGGDLSVRDAFDAWSAQDELAYRGEGTQNQIKYQWKNSDTSREQILTIKSLEYEVMREKGVVVSPKQLAEGVPAEGFNDIERIDTEVERFQTKKNGELKVNYHNILVIVNAETIRGKPNELLGLFTWNQLMNKAEFRRTPPWVKGDLDYKYVRKPISDDHLTHMLAYISKKYKTDFSLEMAVRAIDSAARRNPYHPVQEYIKRLKWDGKKRIDTWIPEYTHCKDSQYSRSVGKRFLIGAVARAMEPGCKMDNMLVLEGAQGIRKTTMIQVLAGEWYRSPTLKSLGDKEAILACLGAWICEIEEMAAAKSTGIEELKKFISSTSDTIRLIYEKYPIDVPRGCVLIGSLNPIGDNCYLHDSSGGRRFWPIECRGKIDTIKLESERDQLWAEAYYEYCMGTQWHLTEVEDALAKMEQAQRLDDHPWMELIGRWLCEGEGQDIEAVSSIEIWNECLGHNYASIAAKDQHAIGRCMRALGWSKMKTTKPKRPGEKSSEKPTNKFVRPGKENRMGRIESTQLEDLE